MSSCIFCRIVQGDVPSAQVYSSSNVLAFLDVAPVHFGHVLVIPRAHYPTLWDLPTELGNELLEAMRNVSAAVRRATRASGLNVMMNNLRAAGQLVDHAHFHLIPRHDNDGLQLWPQSAYPDQEKMQQVAEAIKAELL
jgi:histidine triad (HIT) family protein